MSKKSVHHVIIGKNSSSEYKLIKLPSCLKRSSTLPRRTRMRMRSSSSSFSHDSYISFRAKQNSEQCCLTHTTVIIMCTLIYYLVTILSPFILQSNKKADICNCDQEPEQRRQRVKDENTKTKVT